MTLGIILGPVAAILFVICLILSGLLARENAYTARERLRAVQAESRAFAAEQIAGDLSERVQELDALSVRTAHGADTADAARQTAATRVAVLENELALRERTLERKTADANHAVQQAHESTGKIAVLEVRLAEAETAAAAVSAAELAARERLATCEAALASCGSQLVETNTRLAALTSDTEVLQTERNSLRETVSDLQAELARLRLTHQTRHLPRRAGQKGG